MELDKKIRYSFYSNYINDPGNGGILGQLFDLVELASNRARTYHRKLGLCRKESTNDFRCRNPAQESFPVVDPATAGLGHS
jgi:hypothetical protein